MVGSTRIPEDCPAWLAQWIGKSDQRLENIEKSLVRLVKRNVGSKENPPKDNQLTFKWVVEKLVVPAGFVLAGYLFARGG